MDLYLLIPWVLGIPAWLLARQRRAGHPLRWGIAFFLLGSGIVLLLDIL
jgi:hypothetical protein